MKNEKRALSKEQSAELLKTLKTRFENNMNRHPFIAWADVQEKLQANPEKPWSLKGVIE